MKVGKKGKRRTGSSGLRRRGPSRLAAGSHGASGTAARNEGQYERRSKKSESNSEEMEGVRTGCFPFFIWSASGSQPDMHISPPSFSFDDKPANKLIAQPVRFTQHQLLFPLERRRRDAPCENPASTILSESIPLSSSPWINACTRSTAFFIATSSSCVGRGGSKSVFSGNESISNLGT